MDTVGFLVTGHVPAFEGMPHYNTDGDGGAHLYLPWWLWDHHDKLGFPRGYHSELGGGYPMPQVGTFHQAASRYGFGLDSKKKIRAEYGCTVSFSGRGEMIPNEHSYCEIDPNVVDKWGIPVLRFHFKRSDHEWKLARHMERTYTDIIETMGGRVLPLSPTAREASGMTIPGTLKHEVGTTRMGNEARSSVVNSFCQTHEVPNLFVCDGGPLVSSPDKNPTHTINALSWRASDYMAEEMRKGAI